MIQEVQELTTHNATLRAALDVQRAAIGLVSDAQAAEMLASAESKRRIEEVDMARTQQEHEEAVANLARMRKMMVLAQNDNAAAKGS